MPSSTAAIQAAVVSFMNAFNNLDANGFAACFAEDGEFTNVFGQKATGRKLIEEIHAPMFTEPQTPGRPSFVHARLEILENQVRLIRLDVATADVKWRQTGAIAPNGQPWGDRIGLLSLVFTLEQGTWLIASMHNMDIPTGPPRS
jgi:uncharacterized protein (TIGR02246 family)